MIAFGSGKPIGKFPIPSAHCQVAKSSLYGISQHVCVHKPGSAQALSLQAPYLRDPLLPSPSLQAPSLQAPYLEALHRKAPAFRAPYLRAWYLHPEPAWLEDPS